MTGVTLRFTGSIEALSPADRDALLARAGGLDGATLESVRAKVAEILNRVRLEGDGALRDLARELDHVTLEALEVPRARWDEAVSALDPALRASLERAANNLAAFHRAQVPAPITIETEPGIELTRRAEPLMRVGIYAPGGRASYPSSVLMAAIPAREAGVTEIILCSPPERSGLPSPVVLAAAAIAGVDRVFALGGAGAVGAMAFGTASVPRVDRVVGPGNAYVAEAKLAVARDVAIDSPAGPSEILVIADASADPLRVARELLAQAEHDPAACAVAVTVGDDVAAEVRRAIEELLERDASYAARRAIILEALGARGGLLSATSMASAIRFANDYAAEHLLLAIAEPDLALTSIRATGTVFLGDGGSVAFGDYMTGANHVLPTQGFARSFSGLSTLDFMRWTTWQRISAGAAARLANDVALFADAERLPAHAAAARSFSTGTGAGMAALSQAAGTARADGYTPVSRPAEGSNAVRARAPAGMGFAASDALPRARAVLEPSPSYQELVLYRPNRTPCAIDLSDNTNQFGVPPAARRVLHRLESRAVTRYPSAYGDELRAELARYAGAGVDEVVTGCGSDDVLDSAIRAFTRPGDRVAYLDPTFAMIPAFARMNGLEPVAVPFAPGFDADVEALLATNARVIYLCSPNNPTGTVLPAQSITQIAAEAPGLVILDQAYDEFHAPGSTDARSGIPRAPRLLVVRTLSKAFGLAGLRLGYGIGDRTLIDAVAKSRGPFKVSAAGERAAIAALTQDREWVAARVRVVKRNRRRFLERLRSLGARPLPSRANFVLVPVKDAREADAALRGRDVAARPFSGLAGIGDAIRITIGRWRQMEAVLEALEQLAPELGFDRGAPPGTRGVEAVPPGRAAEVRA